MDIPNGNRFTWMEYLRLVTPFLLFIITFTTTRLVFKLDDIDAKLFSHLTNDEIHAPRSMFVDKANFDLYQKMRDREMMALYDTVACIRADIKSGFSELQERRKK